MKKKFKLYKYMTEREVRLQKIAERMRKRYRKKFITTRWKWRVIRHYKKEVVKEKLKKKLDNEKVFCYNIIRKRRVV